MSDPAAVSVTEQRLKRSRRRRRFNPITNPSNSWTWRFLPGLVLGFGLSSWMSLGRQSRPAGSKTQDAIKDEDEEPPQAPAPNVPIPAPGEEMKMVLVVNDELKMTKGKIAAQCGHAVYGITKKLQKKHGALLDQWERTGQAKIALRGDGGEDQLRELAEVAGYSNIAAHAVFDAGRTQIAAGSMTVVALGPAGKASLDKVTGHLKLL